MRNTLNKPFLPILHNLGRSGGTLIGKCLGCMQDIYLLSEIHPLGTQIHSPLQQAHVWHGLLTPGDIEDLTNNKQQDFVSVIKLLHQRSGEKGGQLVLRDWAHLDFIAKPFVQQPSNRFLLAEALAPAFELAQLSLVRHPVDQWLSLSRLAVLQESLTLTLFLRAYRNYAEASKKIGFIRYEDFTRDPSGQVITICEKLHLNYDSDFLTKWVDYNKVSGDTMGHSRGSKLREIKSMPGRPVSKELKEELHDNVNYLHALGLLGYEDV